MEWLLIEFNTTVSISMQNNVPAGLENITLAGKSIGFFTAVEPLNGFSI